MLVVNEGPWDRDRWLATLNANADMILNAVLGRTRNVFCATGPGGGVDPHCSPGSSESSVPPPAERGSGEEVRASYIRDAAKVAEMDHVRRRVERVNEKMQKNDARWSKVQEKVAGMEDRKAALSKAHDREVAKLDKMFSKELGGSQMSEELKVQAEKTDEALDKFFKYKKEMTDKAWVEIRKHVSSEDNRFETGNGALKQVKLAENTGGKQDNNLSDRQREAVRQVEKRLSGAVSSSLRQRIEETDVRAIPVAEEQRDHFKGTRHGGDGQSVYLSAGSTPAVVAHELGHSLETNANVHAAAQGFLHARVGTEPAKAMEGGSYKPWEVGRDDEFSKAFGGSARYVGKHYKTDDTEVVSMGLEKMHDDPVHFARHDPHYFKFMLGVLDGSFS